ncbi:MAG: hypothetical protein K8U57_31295 [Planctomycetes bacterium]|nr:hypothetical protein [Planctomycetota bacterium]
MGNAPSDRKKQELIDRQLQVRLDRLRRVKEELWEECLPIPPELEEKIREVRKALGLVEDEPAKGKGGAK